VGLEDDISSTDSLLEDPGTAVGESGRVVSFLGLILTDVFTGMTAKRGGPLWSTLPFANFRRPNSRVELGSGGTPSITGSLDAVRLPEERVRMMQGNETIMMDLLF